MLTRRPLDSLGYTLVETVMVMIVVGILGTAFLTRTDAVTKRSIPDQADLLRRDLGHLQSLALTYGVALRFNVTATGYSVSCLAVVPPCATVGATLLDPTTSQAFAVSLPSGVTMSALNSSGAATATVDFDSLGRPSSSGNLIATNPVRTFALAGASKTSTVYLRPITGFTEVSY